MARRIRTKVADTVGQNDKWLQCFLRNSRSGNSQRPQKSWHRLVSQQPGIFGKRLGSLESKRRKHLIDWEDVVWASKV